MISAGLSDVREKPARQHTQDGAEVDNVLSREVYPACLRSPKVINVTP